MEINTKNLFKASINGNLEEIKNILKHNPSWVNEKDKDDTSKKGFSALHHASLNGHTDIVQLLLTSHANVNQQSTNGTTSLIEASANGHTGIVSLLFNNAADLNTQCVNGNTALIMAARGGHKDTCVFLLEKDADAELANVDGFQALQWAAFLGHAEVVLAIVRHFSLKIQSQTAALASASGDDSIPVDVTTSKKAKGLEFFFTKLLGSSGGWDVSGVDCYKLMKDSKIEVQETTALLKRLLQIKNRAGINALQIAAKKLPIEVIDQILKELTINMIVLDANSIFVGFALKSERAYLVVKEKKHLAFHIFLMDSFSHVSIDKQVESRVSRIAKSLNETVIEFSMKCPAPITFIMIYAAALKLRAKKIPMLRENFLSSHYAFVSVVCEVMGIRELESVPAFIQVLGGTSDAPFAFLADGPMEIAMRFELAQFVMLARSQELLSLAFGARRFVEALTPFWLSWKSEVQLDDRWSLDMHRRLPCLRAFTELLLRVLILALTCFALVTKDMKSKRVVSRPIMFMISGFFLEEIHKLMGSFCSSSFWDVFDLLIIALYVIWSALIELDTSSAFLEIGQICLALNACLIVFRFLKFGTFFEWSGFLVAVLLDMLTDLFNFAYIFALTLFGFAIFFAALFEDMEQFKDFPASLLTLCSAGMGNFDFGVFENHANKSLGLTMYMVYVILSSLLLLNLLIALLSVTFTKTQERQYEKYCLLFGGLLKEFSCEEEWFPGPLCLINAPLYILKRFEANKVLRPMVVVLRHLIVLATDLLINVVIIIPFCLMGEIFLMLHPYHWPRFPIVFYQVVFSCPSADQLSPQLKIIVWIGYRLSFLFLPFWFLPVFLCGKLQGNWTGTRSGLSLQMIIFTTHIILVILSVVWFPLLLLFEMFQPGKCDSETEDPRPKCTALLEPIKNELRKQFDIFQATTGQGLSAIEAAIDKVSMKQEAMDEKLTFLQQQLLHQNQKMECMFEELLTKEQRKRVEQKFPPSLIMNEMTQQQPNIWEGPLKKQKSSAASAQES